VRSGTACAHAPGADGVIWPRVLSADLHGRLERAQAKSAEAQRVLAVLDDLVVVQVLSPLQRAVLVVESVPAAPDTLALVDTIAGIRGEPATRCVCMPPRAPMQAWVLEHLRGLFANSATHRFRRLMWMSPCIRLKTVLGRIPDHGIATALILKTVGSRACHQGVTRSAISRIGGTAVWCCLAAHAIRTGPIKRSLCCAGGTVFAGPRLVPGLAVAA